MKRHIEFRAKRTDNGEWVYGYVARFRNVRNQVYTAIIQICDDETKECNIQDLVPVLDETICEYTGLTDKNGNKIFEDDIVSIGELSAVKVCGCYVVKYNTKQARYGLFTADGAEQAGFNFDTMKSYNIIGNIYDNPELLLKAEQQ